VDRGKHHPTLPVLPREGASEDRVSPFWHDFFGLNTIHLPKGPLLAEQWRAFGAMEFPDITPLALPPVVERHAVTVKAKREKPMKPVLSMRKRA
jgi:hypothetical protein